MKNLDIKSIKKNLKYKIFPLVLSTTIIFASGCNSNNRKKYKSSYDSTINSSSTIENSTPTEYNSIPYSISGIVPLIDSTSFDYNNLPINFNNSDLLSFKSYLDNLSINYQYSNLYNIDGALNEYNKISLTTNHDNSLSTLDANKLYDIVIKNNNEYINNSKYSLYDKLDDMKVKELCNLIISTTKDFINDNNMIDENRVKCLLSNLKIFSKPSANNAFITTDNCFVISPHMLNVANMINGEGTDKDVFIHEINHILQKECNCDLKCNPNLYYNYGFSYNFDNLKVNSLDFSWFYEASAEKNMINYTNDEALVYKNMINYLESLSLVNVLNDNFEVHDTEKLSFYKDINSLYDYFNITSDSDKKEILNLMYSIEIMQQKPDDFYKVLTQNYNFSKDEALVDKINYELKVPICETLTKLFYKNLTYAANENEMSLGDIFYLISLYENDLNVHLSYDEINKYEYFEDFYEFYCDIQSNFFNIISNNCDYSQEDIKELFNNYAATIIYDNGDKKDNFSLEWLVKEKKDYLISRAHQIKNNATVNLVNAYDQLLNNNKQKVIS